MRKKLQQWFGRASKAPVIISEEVILPSRRHPSAAPAKIPVYTPAQESHSSHTESVDGEVAPKSRRRRRKPNRDKSLQAEGGRDVLSSLPEPIIPEILQQEPWELESFRVEPEEGKIRFHDLGLPLELMRAISEAGFTYCTPIQGFILPHTLAGKDAAGKAQTGTGKSAAFLLTILHRLLVSPLPGIRPGTPRALIMAPTRELALQIEKDARVLAKYMSAKIVCLFGGIDFEKQRRLLEQQQVDIIVATPGRLLDFKRRGDVHLGKVEIMVIDEADRMLDMGFIPDIKQIINATPPKNRRQTLFFSATLTTDVVNLSSQWTTDAVRVEIEPDHVTASTITQTVYILTRDQKFPLLYNLLIQNSLERVIVFANRRDETRRLSEKLNRYGIKSAILSGDIAQGKRIKTLESFRAGTIKVLVATDVAARGIHVDAISHVVNYSLPNDPEDYVHRIGRTGRAGSSGISVSFADEDDSFFLPDIETYIGQKFEYIHPDESMTAPPPREAMVALPPEEESAGRNTGRPRAPRRRR
ncbi:DEAD/DEAH box helicase [Chrysiogenes arsenatis]|uniref:DEAD/DEAH box helicase n=1 Tax=Chrysiogenes arsenatis TaxID=309797 RepID=UPI000A01BD16